MRPRLNSDPYGCLSVTIALLRHAVPMGGYSAVILSTTIAMPRMTACVVEHARVRSGGYRLWCCLLC
jgi:hypothetical protein